MADSSKRRPRAKAGPGANPGLRELASRLHTLFQGTEKAHGVYYPREGAPTPKGKKQGGQAVELTPPTVELWEQHLAGERGLGVFMLRSDATVRFAALDVDVYPLDPGPLLARIREAGLPLVYCKSKSGGAHLYLFGAEDLPAGLVRDRLAAWAATLGLSGVEIYPHKERLAGPGDNGKYLNMPYFAGVERPALDPQDAGELTAAQFLGLAEARRVTVAELEALRGGVSEDLADGPPCLQSLLTSGPVSQYRDNVMVNLAVYLRQRYPDEWEHKVEEYHRRHVAEPLTSREIVKIINSVNKRNYNYLCNQEPIQPRCNSAVCTTRRYGVRAVAEAAGAEAGWPLNLDKLVKYTTDPPTWEVHADGAVLRLKTDQLINFQAFRRTVLEARNVLLPSVKADTWHKMLQGLLENVEIVEAPGEAGESGQIRWYLEQFAQNYRARTRDELKDGRCWWNPADGMIYFRLTHFNEYLIKHRVYGQDARKLASQFRSWGFEHGYFNIKGAGVNWWRMPQFEAQTEPDDVPRPATDTAEHGSF